MPPKSNEVERKRVETSSEEPDETEKELVEHELVLNYMKSRLGKYQESEERLFVENIKLKKDIFDQEANFKDINAYLQEELSKKSERLQQLEQQRTSLEKTLKQVSNDSEFVLSKLRRENETLRNELEKKMTEFNKKIRGTQEFLTQKEGLEEELNALKRTMEEETKEHERKLADWERAHIQEKENWKRDTARKVKEAKAQMMQLTDNQLEITTKRTIMENEQMASELAYQSKQTENTLYRNEELRDGNLDLKRQIELSKQTQDEFAKRNLVSQRTIHRLLCKMKEEKNKKLEDEHENATAREELRQEQMKVDYLKIKLEESEETVAKLNSQCMQAKEEISTLKFKKDEDARFLLRCMEYIKKNNVSAVTEVEKRDHQDEPLVIPGHLSDLLDSQCVLALMHLLQQLGVPVEKEPIDSKECLTEYAFDIARVACKHWL